MEINVVFVDKMKYFDHSIYRNALWLKLFLNSRQNASNNQNLSFVLRYAVHIQIFSITQLALGSLQTILKISYV